MQNPQRMILEAISLATRQHQGQLRKDGRTPYVAHPLRVLTILAVVFKVQDPEVLAAAALHDLIEDTTADRDDVENGFGPRVAAFVAALSKDMRLPEPERERQYMQQLLESPPEVKLCKLADVLDNLSDLEGMSETARRRKLVQARETLEAFEAELMPQWNEALDQVRQQIAALER